MSICYTSKILTLSAIASASAFAATAYINQIGYRTGDVKELAIVDGSGTVDFVDASGKTALSVTPGNASNWEPSGQNVQLVDFSALKDAGTYTIKQNGNVLRSDLKVADKAYEEVLKASLKWYYYQRSSMALEQSYAGEWARAAGHPDTDVKMHSSTGASGSISSPKGWYDAGDYGKYIVNSGITTYTLLSLYEHFPEYFKTLKWNIPADGSLPDLLAEIKYNLDWMLTMQANDGAVYHKVSTLGFPGDVMPDKDDAGSRYVIGKGSAATFDFAGVMAVAARVYKPFDATYANKCLEAAKKAYSWGKSNPNVAYSNPMDVSTGEYGDKSLGDEKAFAGTELFVTTGDASYKPSGNTEGNVPNWGDVSGLAVYGTATHATEYGGDATTALATLTKLADEFANRTKTGFGVVMAKDDFVWGSNAVAGNQGIWLLHAYYLTGEQKYYDAAVKVLDYLLGKNPLDMSFVTGFGTKSPKLPHHRPSTADGVSAPVPGMIVGGPQPGGEDIGSQEWECRDYRTGHPATSYTDNRCSYASNEVAINWNAPLAYLAGAIEALNAGFAPSFAATGVKGTDAIVPSRQGSALGMSDNTLQFRVVKNKLVVEKNGVRYDLKGKKLK
ncbi:MAG: glycoside hydrolase family 9 protein [Fibrobacter sp.]|nr:glycoside hydrolase family 9 protein [Fibrobacter sp.]